MIKEGKTNRGNREESFAMLRVEALELAVSLVVSLWERVDVVLKVARVRRFRPRGPFRTGVPPPSPPLPSLTPSRS